MNHAGPRHGPGSTDAHEALIELGEGARALFQRFSLPTFHHSVLGHGAVPLPVLARDVRQWQAQQVGA
jgi:uncharacterized protein (DUF885 family)